jgi:hypothetical protein
MVGLNNRSHTAEDISKIISARKCTTNMWYSASLTETQITHKNHTTRIDFDYKSNISQKSILCPPKNNYKNGGHKN